MSNSRTSAEFNFLNHHYRHLSSEEEAFVKECYRQFTTKIIIDRYEEFKALVESVKIRLGHKCSAYKEDCTFRKFESGNRLSY